jgi:hypothetical protein
MSSIGDFCAELKSDDGNFVVEALAKELHPDWVREALRETGKESIRERLLPATFTLWFVILLGLFRRVSYVNLLEKLVGSPWVGARWPEGGPPNTTAVTSARDRLGMDPLRHLWERSAREWQTSSAGMIFHDRRVYALDGSTFKTPDTEENRRWFGKPGASRGRAAYPQMRAVLVVDIGARLIAAERHGPYSSCEIQLARELLPVIPKRSLVLMDRHFLAYDLLWDLHAGERDFVVRVPKNIKPRLLRRLGPGDAIVEVAIPRNYRRTRPDMPRTWTLRMISYRPAGRKETIRLFTSLVLETEITKAALAALYHERWEEETVIDEIKTHLCDCQTVNRAVVFRSRASLRVEQEWYGLLLAYNGVRKVMGAAAEAEEVCPCRLSFTAAVERLRETVYDMLSLSTRRLPARYARLLLQVARADVPERPGRKNPRAVKIKMSKFPLKPSKRAA